jgi:hypothetical protein
MREMNSPYVQALDSFDLTGDGLQELVVTTMSSVEVLQVTYLSTNVFYLFI